MNWTDIWRSTPVNWPDFIWGMMAATTFWGLLHPMWVRWRSRRNVDGFTIWIEETDDRGRSYAPSVMYRMLWPDSKPGSLGSICLVHPAMAKYIREHT